MCGEGGGCRQQQAPVGDGPEDDEPADPARHGAEVTDESQYQQRMQEDGHGDRVLQDPQIHGSVSLHPVQAYADGEGEQQENDVETGTAAPTDPFDQLPQGQQQDQSLSQQGEEFTGVHGQTPLFGEYCMREHNLRWRRQRAMRAALGFRAARKTRQARPELPRRTRTRITRRGSSASAPDDCRGISPARMRVAGRFSVRAPGSRR